MRNSKLDFALLALAGFLAGLTFAPSRVLAGIIQAIVPQAVPIANKRGNSTVFQLASTNTAAANGTLLCQDALGNATSTGCFVPPGQLTYYMSDTASDVATYLQLTVAPFSPKTQLDFTGIGNGTSTIQNWATVPGQPGIVSIPAGLYSFHLHASKTAGANVSIQTQFWEVSATGVDIGLIGVSDATGNLTTSELQYDMDFADGNTYTLASAASRIVARVQAVVTSGPGAAHIFVGGTADSHISIPNPGGGSGGGSVGTPGSTFFSSTTQAGPDDSAVETSLIGTVVGSQTIPANTFVNGAVVEVRGQGYFSLPAVADSLTFKAKCGSTVLGSATFTPGAGAITNGTFRLWLMLTAIGTGSGGAIMTNGLAEMSGSALIPTTVKVLNASNVAYDFTTSCAFDITAQWGAAQVGETIKGTNAAAWIPGSPVSSVNGAVGAVAVTGTNTAAANKRGNTAVFQLAANTSAAAAGTAFCDDGSGNVTTSGCASGGGGSFVLVEQHAASNSAELDFTTCISATYDTYQIELVEIVPATDNAKLGFQVHISTGYDTTAGHYAWQAFAMVFNTSGGNGSASDAAVYVANGQTNGTNGANFGGSYQLYNPGGSSRKIFTGIGTGWDQSGTRLITYAFGGTYAQTTVVDGFRVIASAGNLTSGTARCYGLAK